MTPDPSKQALSIGLLIAVALVVSLGAVADASAAAAVVPFGVAECRDPATQVNLSKWMHQFGDMVRHLGGQSAQPALLSRPDTVPAPRGSEATSLPVVATLAPAPRPLGHHLLDLPPPAGH